MTDRDNRSGPNPSTLAGDTAGATSVEYGLLAAIVALGLIGILSTLGGSMEANFEEVGVGLATETATTAPAPTPVPTPAPPAPAPAPGPIGGTDGTADPDDPIRDTAPPVPDPPQSPEPDWPEIRRDEPESAPSASDTGPRTTGGLLVPDAPETAIDEAAEEKGNQGGGKKDKKDDKDDKDDKKPKKDSTGKPDK